MKPLTPRQREVVALACERCLTNEQVSDILGISMTTVRNHITSAIRRSGFRSMRGVCYWFGKSQEG